MARSLDWRDFPGDECVPSAPPKTRAPVVAPHESDYAPDLVKATQIGWPDKYDDEGNDMHDLRFSGVDLRFHVGYATPPHPPRHPDANPPSRCQGRHCCYYEIGYIGHWSMFCLFQSKCIMRSARRIQKSVLVELLKREAFSTHREFVSWLFEHMPYSELTTKESELVESLELGEYGFRTRGKLSIKQLKLLKDLYCQASSRLERPPVE